MKINLSKGSEWRKWDLQIHVPGAKHADQYSTENGVDVWDKFVGYIKNSDIAVFGITDYFSIAGYETFRDKIKNIAELKNKQFFPCVELRLDISVNRDSEQLQCHLIFDSDYDISKIKDFLVHLPLKNKKTNGAVAYCTDGDIMACGGYDRVSITKEKLEESLKNSFGNDRPLLIAGVASGMGSNRANANVNIKKELSDIFDDFCDLFFGCEENRKYYLNESRYENKSLKAKAKPVVSTSDCHTFYDLENRLGKKFTVPSQEGKYLERYGSIWIKADPTFEGLKQIIYEPEERVFIGEKPELLSRIKNNTTKYITSLKINQIQGYNDSKQIWFKDIDIPINPGLVCIIGNRGSGKSALADITGLCGNSHLYEEFSFLNKNRFCKDNLPGNFEATLHWLSENDIIKKKLNELTDKNSPERVRYLPQSFFERLTNNLDHYQFNKTIEQVVFSYISKDERLGKNNFEELLNLKKEQNEKEIKNIQNNLEELNKKIIELEKKLHPSYQQQIEEKKKLKEKELEEHNKNKPNEIPNPENDPTISEELKNVQSELNNLNKLLNDTNYDIDKTQNQRDSLRLSIEEIKTIKKELNNFEKDIKDFINKNNDKLKNQHGINLNEIINININYSVLDDKILKLNEEYESAKIKLTGPLEIGDITKKENIENQSLIFKQKNIKKQINDLKSKLSEPQIKYQEYLEQLQKWESIKNQIEGNEQIVDSLKWLNKEIDYLANTLKQDIENLREQRLEISKEIYNINKKYLDLYTSFKNNSDKQIKDFESIMGEYKINIDVSLKMDNSFYEDFLQYINQKFKGSFYGIDEGKKMLLSILEGKDINEDKQFISVLKNIIEYLEEDKRDGITGGKTRYISDQILNEKKWLEFYNYLFSLQYINPEYKLTLGDKDITQLSPGERGALLIVFYLLLDKDGIPLIIDQPEENLDNQSVYKILRYFIVHAKKKRQIIMVTHNPNLAIVGDAEQIIFVKIDKKNGNQFSFESGSIENPSINKHASDILEGTLKAFDIRKIKYFRSED